MNKFNNSFTLTKRSFKILAIFTLLACGPGMADYDEFMSFFMPESANASVQNQKYNYTSVFFYNDNEGELSNDTVDLCKLENIKAWMTYCQGKLSEKEIEKGIYIGLKGSKLLGFLKANKNQAAIEYLQFSQEIDKIYTKNEDSYFNETSVDTTALENLTQKGLILAQKNTKDIFLRERIGFQSVKLFSINKQYENAISSYRQFIAPISPKSFISDWALMRKAEAETALNQTQEAYYDFAQVFDRSLSHRSQADLVARARIDSFQVTNEVLKFCKDDHEKAAVYAFAGIKPATDALTMLEEMVKIDPKNSMIELIMAREINKNEKYYYDQNYGYNYYSDEDSTSTIEARKKATDYWSKLKNFSVICAENQNLPKTGFWEVASAYMEYIQGDFTKSEEFLSQAKAVNTTNNGLKNQILLQELLLITKNVTQITPEVEMNFLPILEKFSKPKDFRMSNAILEACKTLSSKYQGGQGNQSLADKKGWLSGCSSNQKSEKILVNVPHAIAKAYLVTMLTTTQVNIGEEYGGFESQKDMFNIEDTTSLATIEKVISYFSETNKSDFDKRLQKLVGFDNDHLFVLMGRRAMDENNYKKAEEAFGKVSASFWEMDDWKLYFNENPFFISPKYNKEEPNKNYNAHTFAKRMTELEANLKANPNDGESAYLLGCGAYNTTWHGNSWVLRRHYWSSTEVNEYSKTNFNKDYYNVSKAQGFFMQAMKSTNSEVAAKACFGVAQCELANYNVFVYTQEAKPDESPEDFELRMAKLRESKYSSFFALLKTKYQNTQYQKQVLAECGDYKLFTGK
ncbi:MAG: hypothetical protein V4585_18285 [Bacteroidota bacterium]